MNRIFFLTAAIPFFPSATLCAGPGTFPDKSPAPAARSGGWRFSAGYMHRSLGDFDWLTGTRSVPSLLTIGQGSNTPGIDAIGPADLFFNRTYNDGFNFQDGGTAGGGDTWNWGYQNASQVSGDMISFHGGNGTTATFTDSDNYEYGGWSENLDGNAPFFQLEWIQPLTGSLNFGFQGSVSFLDTGAARTLATFTAEKSRTDYSILYTDRYSLGGVIVPQAPYTGGPQGPGALIPNIPVGRTAANTISGGETATAFNSIHTDFDLNLAAISLGPVIEYARGPFALQASAGLTINVADWDVEQRETLFVSRNGATATAQNNWRDRNDGTSVLPGIFLQAAASRELNEHWSLNAFGRYDWVETLHLGAGPSTGSANLSGWSLGAGVGIRF